MSRKVSYLIINYAESVEKYDFNGSLESALKEVIGGSDSFSLDNLSDSLIVEYARRFLDESDEVMIICDKFETSPGPALSLLNRAVKRKNTHLLCIGESKPLKPIVKMMDGKVFDNAAALSEYLKSEIN
ncbi:MAG: hypothetical protein ABJ004_19065 [Cyclobacteriaceae bacterium]